jgi:hypothetical protein
MPCLLSHRLDNGTFFDVGISLIHEFGPYETYNTFMVQGGIDGLITHKPWRDKH